MLNISTVKYTIPTLKYDFCQQRVVEVMVKHITSTPQGKKCGGNLSEKSLF